MVLHFVHVLDACPCVVFRLLIRDDVQVVRADSKCVTESLCRSSMFFSSCLMLPFMSQI